MANPSPRLTGQLGDTHIRLLRIFRTVVECGGFSAAEIELNISGCMNACGHHHIGHIGILGVDKRGEEFYQVQLGGVQGNKANIGKVLGPSFSRESVPSVIRKLLDVYVESRVEGEAFVETYQRVGITPFKERVYAKAN